MIVDSNFSDSRFSKSLFHNVRFSKLQMDGYFTNCIFIGCHFDQIQNIILNSENCQFINCHFEDISKMCFEADGTNFIKSNFIKIKEVKSQFKSCLFQENNFRDLTFNDTPLQHNRIFQNTFSNVKFKKANNLLGTFYKNEYLKTTGLDKELVYSEEQKHFTCHGVFQDDLKNHLKKLGIELVPKYYK